MIFYGLKEKPFNILPDPDYLFMSQGHENTYTHLEYAIVENKGFVVITGEIGSGKTTLQDSINGYRPATHGQVLIFSDFNEYFYYSGLSFICFNDMLQFIVIYGNR